MQEAQEAQEAGGFGRRADPLDRRGRSAGLRERVGEAYGVTGIPANYLAKGGSGEIVGTHLRQQKLDEKLAELDGE